MRNSRYAATIVLLFLVGAAAGCGDSEDRLTAAELTTQGNAVCTDVDKEFEKAFANFDDSEEPTPAQMQEFAATAAEITDDAIGRFEELKPPEDLEGEWDDILEDARAAQQQLEEAGEDREAAARLFSSEEDPFEGVNAGLEKLGITACSDDE
jgi:hypothetical protein